MAAAATATTLGAASTAVGAGQAAQADRALSLSLRDLVALEGGPPGAISVLNRNGKVTAYSAGRANLASAARPGSGRSMRLASTTKAFTAATVLSLVDSGVIARDDTIGGLRPDLPQAWHAATVRQVLQHTAGIPDFTSSEAFVDAFLAAPDAPPTPESLIAVVASQPLDFSPGNRFDYGNSGPIVLGLIIERVTGRPYAAELSERVTDPLRLGRTSLASGTAIPAPRISGYDVSEAPPENVTSAAAWGGWAWASGGLVSTPGNLSGFARGYVGGRLFERAVIREQRRFVPGASSPPGPGRNEAGLGIFRYRTRCGTVFGHTGSILGYIQLFAATADGRRSLTFSVSTQVTPDLLPHLRRAQVNAVCAALARG